jgi:regulator of replication initiation timing
MSYLEKITKEELSTLTPDQRLQIDNSLRETLTNQYIQGDCAILKTRVTAQALKKANYIARRTKDLAMSPVENAFYLLDYPSSSKDQEVVVRDVTIPYRVEVSLNRCFIKDTTTDESDMDIIGWGHSHGLHATNFLSGKVGYDFDRQVIAETLSSFGGRLMNVKIPTDIKGQEYQKVIYTPTFVVNAKGDKNYGFVGVSFRKKTDNKLCTLITPPNKHVAFEIVNEESLHFSFDEKEIDEQILNRTYIKKDGEEKGPWIALKDLYAPPRFSYKTQYPNRKKYDTSSAIVTPVPDKDKTRTTSLIMRHEKLQSILDEYMATHKYTNQQYETLKRQNKKIMNNNNILREQNRLLRQRISGMIEPRLSDKLPVLNPKTDKNEEDLEAKTKDDGNLPHSIYAQFKKGYDNPKKKYGYTEMMRTFYSSRDRTDLIGTTARILAGDYFQKGGKKIWKWTDRVDKIKELYEGKTPSPDEQEQLNTLVSIINTNSYVKKNHQKTLNELYQTLNVYPKKRTYGIKDKLQSIPNCLNLEPSQRNGYLDDFVSVLSGDHKEGTTRIYRWNDRLNKIKEIYKDRPVSALSPKQKETIESFGNIAAYAN